MTIGAILDPTKKNQILKFPYHKIDPNISESNCKKIESELYDLYVDYVKLEISYNPKFSQMLPNFEGGKVLWADMRVQ